MVVKTTKRHLMKTKTAPLNVRTHYVLVVRNQNEFEMNGTDNNISILHRIDDRKLAHRHLRV